MAESWKETLFVWHGDLKRVEEKSVSWKGTWVGIRKSDELPSTEEFNASENTFEMAGKICGKIDNMIRFGGGGTYALEGEEHSDYEHDICLHKTKNSSVINDVVCKHVVVNEHEEESSDSESPGLQVSPSLRLKGLFLHTADILCNIECCIR